jgi:glucose-6-phosphate 1-epimerase
MQSLDALNERFGRRDAVKFETGSGGLVRAAVTAQAAEGHVYLYGAQVTHHRPDGQEALLFLSPRSRFERGRAVRGGVPVVFPWFGARAGDPSAPDHGFARTSTWAVESVEELAGGGVVLTLGLESSESTRRTWPHDFRLTARIAIGAHLGVTLEVENRSDAPFLFEEALHSYLRVGDVTRASITGLEGATYLDKADGMKRKTLGAEPFRPAGETDRVFLGARGTCTVTDPVLERCLVVEKAGSATTVIWNPWRDKAAAMTDLGADHWRSMLCVETANAADGATRLDPGARHSMGTVIRVTVHHPAP